MHALDYIPLWGTFLGTIVCSFLALEGGALLGRRRARLGAEKDASPVGASVSAVLALLAFLLAFTFSLAASRFDERRRLVLDEANAIGTTYLRTSLLQEPQRTELRKLLREYVTVKVDGVARNQIPEAIAASEQLHDKLFAAAAEMGLKDTDSVMGGLFIASLNEVIDLHAVRVVTALRARIPFVIWATLGMVTLLAMAGLGYQAGLNTAQNRFSQAMLLLAFALVILLIVDLDRAREGFLQTSQLPLIELRDKLNSAPL